MERHRADGKEGYVSEVSRVPTAQPTSLPSIHCLDGYGIWVLGSFVVEILTGVWDLFFIWCIFLSWLFFIVRNL